MITIIDYKTGNLGSIQNMLKKIRVESIVTSDPVLIEKATKIILPGVGSFDQGMNNLLKLNLREILDKKVLTEKIPVLGICLGMQIMTKKSEEGSASGLSWINAETVKFRFDDQKNFKSPHMGWNYVSLQKQSRLFTGIGSGCRFYFVHAYFMKPENPADTLTTTHYENEFTSSFERENIIGVQFHPEKSHKFGMALLKNFAELY